MFTFGFDCHNQVDQVNRLQGRSLEDITVDLHKRVAAAIAQGPFTSHNMRESNLDGDQGLTFWIRSLEEVLREILGDERMACHQHFTFVMVINKEGERECGASNGAVSLMKLPSMKLPLDETTVDVVSLTKLISGI